jgi:hypothetical protein
LTQLTGKGISNLQKYKTKDTDKYQEMEVTTIIGVLVITSIVTQLNLEEDLNVFCHLLGTFNLSKFSERRNTSLAKRQVKSKVLIMTQSRKLTVKTVCKKIITKTCPKISTFEISFPDDLKHGFNLITEDQDELIEKCEILWNPDSVLRFKREPFLIQNFCKTKYVCGPQISLCTKYVVGFRFQLDYCKEVTDSREFANLLISSLSVRLCDED